MADNHSSIHEIPRSGRAASEIGIRSGTIPLNRTEVTVTVRTECDQFPTSESSYGSADHEHSKAHEMSLREDLESGHKN